MTQPIPPGMDPILWNIALLVTAVQQLQTQAQPITAQQVTAVQAILNATPTVGATSSVVVSQGQAPVQQPVTPP